MTQRIDTYHLKLEKSQQRIDEPITKIGGEPVFLNEADIPKCRCCKNDMDFIAQIRLDNPIELSQKYTIAYVFMCAGKFDENGWLLCETWESNSGANAVILQKDTMENLPMTQRNQQIIAKYPEYIIEFEHSKEPTIDTSDYEVDEDLRQRVYDKTKIGGVPFWLQNNDTSSCPNCNGAMKFIAQINAELDGVLPANPAEWDNYNSLPFGGGDGIGYLFLCEKECGSNGTAFLWQCT